MMDKIIGRCSLCGGNVTVATYTYSTVPPVPTCQSCGATAAQPTINMERRKLTPEEDGVIKRVLRDGNWLLQRLAGR